LSLSEDKKSIESFRYHRYRCYRRCCALCCVALILLALVFPAQSYTGGSGRAGSFKAGGVRDVQEPVDVIRVRTDEVVVPVSVRDERGAPVNGLSEDQFLVYENGVRQEIASFNRRRVPANIVLLMDASGSVFYEMNLIREAARTFLQELVPGDQVSVMQFADRVELLADWTRAEDAGAINKALAWRYHAGERTAFYEGLQRAAEIQLKKVEGRRIIILLTDGIDTAGRGSFSDALTAVRVAEASVYVVSLTVRLREELERKVGGRLRAFLSGISRAEISRYRTMIDDSERQLISVSEETGGRVFFPHETENLTPAYRAIAEELRTQYILTYVPKKGAGTEGWRELRVLVLPGGFDVATRSGYHVRH